MNSTKHILIIALKSIVSLVLVALFAVIITSVSLVYDFHKIEPFSGPDIFNPYSQIDSTHCWKRAGSPLSPVKRTAARKNMIVRNIFFILKR